MTVATRNASFKHLLARVLHRRDWRTEEYRKIRDEALTLISEARRQIERLEQAA